MQSHRSCPKQTLRRPRRLWQQWKVNMTPNPPNHASKISWFSLGKLCAQQLEQPLESARAFPTRVVVARKRGHQGWSHGSSTAFDSGLWLLLFYFAASFYIFVIFDLRLFFWLFFAKEHIMGLKDFCQTCCTKLLEAPVHILGCHCASDVTKLSWLSLFRQGSALRVGCKTIFGMLYQFKSSTSTYTFPRLSRQRYYQTKHDKMIQACSNSIDR